MCLLRMSLMQGLAQTACPANMFWLELQALRNFDAITFN